MLIENGFIAAAGTGVDTVPEGGEVVDCAGAIVCPGVGVGEGAIVGAGSVVVKDVPARVVAAGNPCRVIREL